MRYILLFIPLLLAGCANTSTIPNAHDITSIGPEKDTVKVDNRRDVKYITIHHTDGVMEKADQAIKKFNVRHKTKLKNTLSCKGYYVGYHYVIGVNGDVIKTRCEYEKGNHDPNHNSQSIGIALVGTFYNYEPTEKQYQALNSLIEDIKVRYDGIYVLAHRDEKEKDPCPGPKFDRGRIRGIQILSIK